MEINERIKLETNMCHYRSKYGYIKASKQDLEAQTKQLILQEIPQENIRVEENTQTTTVWNQLISHELKEHDLLVIPNLSSCCLTAVQFLEFQKRLWNQSITLIALDLPYSKDPEINQFINATLAALADFESRKKQVPPRHKVGRKTVITESLIGEVRYFKENLQMPITQIAQVTGKGRSTIYKILKEHLGYSSSYQLLKKDLPVQQDHSS